MSQRTSKKSLLGLRFDRVEVLEHVGARPNGKAGASDDQDISRCARWKEIGDRRQQADRLPRVAINGSGVIANGIDERVEVLEGVARLLDVGDELLNSSFGLGAIAGHRLRRCCRRTLQRCLDLALVGRPLGQRRQRLPGGENEHAIVGTQRLREKGARRFDDRHSRRKRDRSGVENDRDSARNRAGRVVEGDDAGF